MHSLISFKFNLFKQKSEIFNIYYILLSMSNLLLKKDYNKFK